MSSTDIHTAWMIKNDGAEIPVVAHIYADNDETDELLALAYFLWKNDKESGWDVLALLDVWSFHVLAGKLRSRIFAQEEVIDAVQQYLASRPYRIFPEEFAGVIASCAFYLRRRGKGECVTAHPVNGMYLIDTLNQKFLRARYGGRYNTAQGCRDMFFRVSSVGFDWYPIIRGFVEKRADIIETVTIVRDFETTGCEKYYADFDGRPFNQMSISDFHAGNGNTNLLAPDDGMGDTSWYSIDHIMRDCYKLPSLRYLRHLPQEYERIHRRVLILSHKENENLKVWSGAK